MMHEMRYGFDLMQIRFPHPSVYFLVDFLSVSEQEDKEKRIKGNGIR